MELVTERPAVRRFAVATSATVVSRRVARSGPELALVARLRRLSDSTLDSLMLVGALVFGVAFTGLLVLLVEIVPPLVLASETGL